MKETLDIDDDVFEAAEQIATAKGLSTDRVVSDLVRRGLELAGYLEPKR